MNDRQDVVTLTIDGQKISVPRGTTVYNAAKMMGIDIPIFCYHDRMKPFGACRVCLVHVENMAKLQTSCTLEAAEGMVVQTQAKNAVDGRKGIVELLLVNHPLDCPICDRAGECPLQENALHHGPGKSRFFEEKRRFQKAIPLSPVLTLDRERCIACARCTRFGEDVSGDNALVFLERGHKTEVGTANGEAAESKFIGNTIMICPVGALTSTAYRFRARPWDNATTQTTCTLCPVGCSMFLDARDGEIVRSRSSESPEVNDIWMCDKGWFGYGHVASEARLKTPLVRRDGVLHETSWEEALNLIAEKISEAKEGDNIAALGGNPLTTEENYLFQQLIRNVTNVAHIDHRLGHPISPLGSEGISPGMSISPSDCEDLSLALFFGIDITEEFPLIWLRLKQAFNKGGEGIFFGHYAPEIQHHLSEKYLHRPGEELAALEQHLPHLKEKIERLNGKKCALFVGRQYLASPARAHILAQLLQLQKHMPELSLNIMEGSGNSMGARFAGMHPELIPGHVRTKTPGMDGKSILEKALFTGWQLLYIAGSNPAAYFPKLWPSVRQKVQFLVVHELFLTETAQHADIVLPTLAAQEKEGTFINIEGRIQHLAPGKAIPKNLRSDGDIFCSIARKLDLPLEISLEFTQALKREKIVNTIPIEIHTQAPKIFPATENLISTFSPALFDTATRMRHTPHLSQLTKSPYVRIHPEDAYKRNLTDGDRVNIQSSTISIAAQLKIDAGVATGTAVLPTGFVEAPFEEMSLNLFHGFAIEILKI